MMATVARPVRTPVPEATESRQPEARVALSLLDKLHRGVIVMTANARPIIVNRAAMTMLARGDAMSLNAGQFTLHDHKARHALEKFMGCPTAEGAGDAETLALRVERTNALPPHRLLAMRVDDDASAADNRSPLFAIFIYEPHAGRFIPTRVLTDVYGLSRTEARFAAELFAGHSVQRAASRLNITVNTAKTHLKNVFAKCEVQSQAELLQLLALGPRTC